MKNVGSGLLVLVTICVGAALFADPGLAQEREVRTIQIGDKVRVVAPLPEEVGRPIYRYRLLAPPEEEGGGRVEYRLRRVIGTLLRAEERRIMIDPEGDLDSLAVSTRTMASLEVSRGQESRTMTGAGIGLMVGVVLGGLIGAGGASGDDDTNFIEGVGRGSAIGAGPGAVVGLIFGSQVKVDQWELIAGTRPTRRGASLLPGGGVRFGLGLRF